MKKFYFTLLLTLIGLLVNSTFMHAQQVPNPSFEDWSGDKFDGDEQPKSWYVSNISQAGFNFNLAHREAGHSGSYSLMVKDTEVGAMGITETSPGYFSLGKPWSYISGLNTGTATAGTSGGINFTFRPDTMSVWIKRTGPHVVNEDFYLLYYAWSGTAKGEKYKAKNGDCSSVSQTNEESDIRLALDANECGTIQKANQIAEGMWREKKEYGQWTNIRVPIYYFNNDVPTMMNMIFSASNYPNFRAKDGLYEDNALYVDDIELIYSSKIDKLYIGGKEWKGFNPDTQEEQTYSLGRTATIIPEIKAVRGSGSITNARGTTVAFSGRELTGSEISIIDGTIDGTPVTITVKSGDDKSTSTYKVKFVREASKNPKLADILVNGKSINNFQPDLYNYTIELPYGTKDIPQVTVEAQEDEQTIVITQPTSTSGTATIHVTAADKKTTATYTLQFKVALLADNTLRDIKVNGTSVLGFTPNQTTYRVSLPTTTTTMPTVEAISAYPAGEQTITHTKPSTIDGGTYLIDVTTPGNPTPKTYRLNFKLEASSYSMLKSLQMGDNLIPDFNPTRTTYYVNLPVGTTELPAITFEKGEPTQQVTVQEGGLDGTTTVTVLAGNGIDQTVYKIVVATAKSEISSLNMIYVGGEPLADFAPEKTSYTYTLPIGTTQLPEVTVEQGDEYQTVKILKGGVNGTTRITVTAQNGSSTIYQIAFSVKTATDATLKMIYIDGKPLEGFDPNILEYNCPLPKGTTTLPVITYDQADEYQTVTTRSGGVNGDYKITVRPQTGASQTYILHFSVEISNNTALKMIYLDGQPLDGFDPNQLDYTHVLPMGVTTFPTVTYDKAEEVQKVLNVTIDNVQNIKVTAENGQSQTYTITFIIQRSESAFLKMIYLDGDSLPGFDSNIFDYTVTLSTTNCPIITVDKEEGQQVTITTPYAIGQAKIVVKPESAPANTYTINFVESDNNFALLHNIYVDGTPIANFQPEQFSYSVVCNSNNPTITYEADSTQTVSLFRQGDVITLYVIAGEYKAQYQIHLSVQPNADCTLRSISVDGVVIDGFDPQTRSYTLLQTSNATPNISYEKQYTEQVVVAGMQDADTYLLHVRAQSGDTASYMLHFNRPVDDDANLINLTLQGYEIGFQPTQYEYTVSLPGGYELPNVKIESKPGQSTIAHTVSETEQQVLVTAPSGRTNTYRILYNRQKSTNAWLSDILINGESLEGFDAETYAYTHTLAWRTKVVPCVQPVGSHNDQIITTYHSAIDGTTVIRVLAPDSVTSKEYTIHFPVIKSSNTALEEITLDSEKASIAYHPDQTEYYIAMPYGETEAPLVLYHALEPEQTIDYISRPLGQTSEIIVTAENGDQRTYKLHFMPTYATQPNQLASLTIAETGVTLDPTKTEHAVVLPYATRSMTVNYTKQFPEQTVWVQPGGVQQPTIITVKSNRPDEADVIYTLTPQVDTQDPAVLTELTVNGVTVEGFTPNRFSYIANVTSSPVVRYQVKKGADINVTIQTDKHWQAEVTAEGRTNVYDLWYYYTTDVLPNAELSNWTTAKYNDAPKPAGWQVIADADELYNASLFGKYYSGSECSQAENGVAYLKTSYVGICARNIPGMMTLGNIIGEINTNNSFSISGTIPFHNSPDELKIRYKAPKIQKHNRIVYELTGMNGYAKVEHNDTEAVNDYTELTMNLDAINQQVGHPYAMNIILNSYYGEQGGLGSEGMGTVAEMYVDYLRFAYNSRLTGLTVNDSVAAMDGNTFSYTLTDPENTLLPTLAFTGEVADQAQRVVWGEETKAGAFGVRTATITNYAEDGTSTEYTLELKRPLDINNLLDNLLVNGSRITGFNSNKTEYEYHLASTTKHLPDVQPIAGSSLQTITTQYLDSAMVITVTPEAGEPTSYRVRFITDLSDDVQLENITVEGTDIAFDPAKTEYTVTANQLPDITFVKKMDGQTVELHNGVLLVTAENGNQGTYTILLNQPNQHTTGQLADIELNGVSLQGFDSNVYEYTVAQPNTIGFKPMAESDSVILVQTPWYMELLVIGDETHTYRLNYPNELSSNTNLKAIYLNAAAYEEFDEQVHDYIVRTDDPTHFHVVANERAAVLSLDYTVGDTTVYTYTVTAEDGTIGQPYTITVMPNLSSTPYLNGIWVDGQLINGFNPNTLTYTHTIPAGAYKVAEPAIPSLHYELGAPRQNVEVEYGNLGETTNFIVTAEDGSAQAVYQVLLEAEPSHCATLTGIAVNGQPIENFESSRRHYSVKTNTNNVQITWSSNDNFQTVTEFFSDATYTLHVIAQDGVTTADYVIEIYTEAVSDDVTLAQILLDGLTFEHFHPTLNPGLEFSSMQQRYTINLPSGTTVLPEVTARLNAEGQTVTINTNGWTVSIHVTAADGITTNTYTLYFYAPMSNNAHLKMIYLDGEPLATFQPEQYNYILPLPVGQTTMPDIYAEPQEAKQTVRDAITGDLQHTIYVTAEDGTTQQYFLAFQFNPSQADTLLAIYGDGVLIDGFRPDSFYYAYNLPVGTTQLPDITWDEADRYQTITPQDIYNNVDGKLTQIQVVAQSGSKNTYTVAYTIEQSGVDTLQMIYIQSDSLVGFNPYINDYYLYLAAGDSVAPSVAWLEGDQYQSVEAECLPYMVATSQIGWKQVITVTAQNGQTRTYTIYFLYSAVLSTNTDLEMIYINGKMIEGFAPDRYNYTHTLIENEPLPSILYEKGDPAQTVTLEMGEVTRIHVTAEDPSYTATYTITFQRQMSSYSYLEAIYQDGVAIEGFRPDSFYYDVVLPYGTTTLPTFTYDLGKEGQTVAVDTFYAELENGQEQVTLRFGVTAPDEISSSEYDVRIVVALNDNCLLQSLTVKGNMIEGFHPDTTHYVIIYPVGTDSTELATIEDIQAIAQDSRAHVNITADGVNFRIQVDSEDGEHSCVYTIEQRIFISDNARLSAIYLSGELIRDFDPEVLEYTYYIVNAQPTIEAVPEDAGATVDYSMYAENEPFYIYVTAPDGTERVYTIYFLSTTIESSQTPAATDVLIKRLPGTNDLAFATLRKNVSVGIYTMDGTLVYYSRLEETTQNDAVVVTNTDGSELLLDVYTYNNVFTVPQTNMIYFYVFQENNRHKISSGKLYIAK